LFTAFADLPIDFEPGHQFTKSHLHDYVLDVSIEWVTRPHRIMLCERIFGLLKPTATSHGAYVDTVARKAMATSKPASASAKPPYSDRKGPKP
jgi:hypothetical protein